MENISQQFILISPADRSDYRQIVAPLATACWPEFMLHDPVADQYWGDLFDRFADYQFGLFDVEAGRAAAMGNSVPLSWRKDLASLPERGWDWAFEHAVSDHEARNEPDILCAIQIAIHPAYQGQALSTRMIKTMRSIGASKGFDRLIAPVRPSQKSLYPLIDIDRYVTWTNQDGLPFDAWLRVHVRAGARIIRVCHESMTICGTPDEWKVWTTMEFPDTGQYHVAGALNPVQMDLGNRQGTYVEPNVWMLHPIA